MTYEPRGKVRILIDAMRAAAAERPVWTSVDVAKVLEATTNAVPAFVAPSISHGALFHKLQNGRSQYSLKPFEPAATAAPVPPRQTTATGWKPPQMGCTRPAAGTIAGRQVVQEPREPAGGAGADLPTCTKSQTDPKCLTAAPPEAAPALADARIQRAVSAAAEPALTIELDAPLDEQQEEAEPLTWAHRDDGDLDLFGLVELENGGYRIQAKDVARLRRMLAWLPA